jgi:hypothetical protein
MPEMAGAQVKSGLRKITRSLSLDLATFVSGDSYLGPVVWL